MKTTKLLLFAGFIFFGKTMNAQTNAVYLNNQPAGPNGVNVSVGLNANTFPVSGGITPVYNVFLGGNAGRNNTTGQQNTFVGYVSGGAATNTTGSYNSGLGVGTLQGANGDFNIGIGYNTGSNMTGGENVVIGRSSGGVNVGSDNVLLGGFITPSSAMSNTVILADGAGNQRFYVHSNGNAGIGLGNYTIPQNRLEVKQGTLGNSGLRLTSLPNTSTSITNPTTKILSVDSNGDVILVNEAGTGAGITNACSTVNFVPKTSAASGNLSCSQIYDNGTSVGIGTTGSFAYTWSSGLTGTTAPPASGNVRLDINGVVRGLAFMATSDKRYKTDIKPIGNALDKIMSLEGKTYHWKKDEFKNMAFSDQLQYGLIAQDVEKVIPSLTIKSDDGYYSLNYIGLIPVLIEAMKEQQTEIEELKTQISENFKAQNTDLINLGNTKIISVSPNPSNDMISVSMNIEKSVASAKLLVHDLNGNVLSSLNINDRDNNITKTLQKDNFGKGIFIISLVANGKSIDTKKIVFN